MASFTERKEYKLEIIPPFSIIQCREASIVEKDGEEVGRTYSRIAYEPGSDITNAPAEVTAVAAALWNAQLIAEYNSHIGKE